MLLVAGDERVTAYAGEPSSRWRSASAWGRAAVVAASASAAGYVLQTILDWVPAPSAVGFGVFWGLFAGDAVIGFVTGIVAIVQGWRWGRRNATLGFGLIGVGWLLLAQAIQIVWD